MLRVAASHYLPRKYGVQTLFWQASEGGKYKHRDNLLQSSRSITICQRQEEVFFSPTPIFIIKFFVLPCQKSFPSFLRWLDSFLLFCVMSDVGQTANIITRLRLHGAMGRKMRDWFGDLPWRKRGLFRYQCTIPKEQSDHCMHLVTLFGALL